MNPLVPVEHRWDALGELLVDYSVGLSRGERAMIAMGELASYPLAAAVYRAVVRRGGYPQVQFLSESLRHEILAHGSDEQLAWVPEIEAYGMEWADVYLGLRGAVPLAIHDDIPAERLAANQEASGKISSLRWEKTRWCLVRVPTEALAREARTDLASLTGMLLAACLVDWPKESRLWRAWAARLARGRTVRLLGKGTDLAFSVAGRQWLVGDGKLNMPDGEIMTAPVEDSVDGEISFETPAVFGGRLVEGLRLGWKGGRLVTAVAATNQAFLRAVLATDAGAATVGEFAFGTNPMIDRFCTDILYDEKIAGTVHIALGRSYPGCGGTNRSAIHWDIVKDTRREGGVFVDGSPVLRDGEFLF